MDHLAAPRLCRSCIFAVIALIGASCDQRPPTSPSRAVTPPSPLAFHVTSGAAAASAQSLVGRFDAALIESGTAAAAAPTNLRATVSGTSVTLTWNASAGATSYVIEVGTGPGLANLGAFNTGSAANAFTGVGVAVGIYHIRVRAVDAQGQSAPSNEETVTVVAVSPTFAFAGPAAPLAGAVSVPFALAFCQPAPAGVNDLCQGGINPTGGQPPYHFQFGTGVGFPPVGLSLSLNGVLSGTPTRAGQSQFAVCAVDTAGRSICPTVTMVVAGCTGPPPFAPSNVQSAVNGTNVTLTWDAPPSTDSYDIEVGSTTGASNLLVMNTGNANTTLAAAAVAGTYYVRIRARNACGRTVPSSEVVVTVGTPPPPPTPSGPISIDPTFRDLGPGGGCTGRTVTVPITVTAPANMRWTVNAAKQNSRTDSFSSLDKYSVVGPAVVTYTLLNPPQTPASFGSCDRTFTTNLRDIITFEFADGTVLQATFTNVLISLR